MKMLFLSSAVAGQLPRKCETVSSSVSQAGQRLVVDLLILPVQVLVESAVSCDEMQCGTVIVPVAAEM